MLEDMEVRQQIENNKKWWIVHNVTIEPALNDQIIFPDGTYKINMPGGKWEFNGKVRGSNIWNGEIKWDNGGQFKGAFEEGLRPKNGVY